MCFAAGGERGRVCGRAKTRWPFSRRPGALCTAEPFLSHGGHLPRRCLCRGVPGGLGACMVLGGGLMQGSVLLFASLEAARGARSCVVADGPDGTARRVPPRARGTGRAQEPSLSRSQGFGATSAISGPPWHVTAGGLQKQSGIFRGGLFCSLAPSRFFC